jgi:two-component system CheB/CheR fusion protein
LFLDSALCVRRFTSQTTKITQLIASDVGRPITDVVSDLFYPELAEDVQQVLRTLVGTEKQVAARDGRWFTARILPYRTLANVIDGVVITFVDITVSKTLETQLRRTQGNLEKRMARQAEKLEKTKRKEIAGRSRARPKREGPRKNSGV